MSLNLCRRAALSLLAAALAAPALGADGVWVHAWASYGEPLYPKDFKHFTYVNPEAPKRGEVYLENPDRRSGFSKMNPFTLKGEWPAGLLIWLMEPLAVRGADEPQTMYGLLAEEMKVAPDRSSVWFRLHPKATFSNGDAVRATDVKFTFEVLRGPKAHPQWQSNLAGVAAAVVEDERTIRFDMKDRDADAVFKVGALMPVFSPKWLQGPGGKLRDLDEVVTDIPIATGPYLVEKQDNGRGLTFLRRKDYWAEGLPVRRGFFNFERVTYRYYQDREVATEAFKAGETDLARVYGARLFARQHKGRKWDDGRIVKRVFTTQNAAGLQSYQLNLRLPKFQDIRVRQAIGLTWDFDASNVYKTFQPADSVFNGSQFAAQGLPSKEELALLEPFRAQLPKEVFGPPYKAPRSNNDPLQMRANLLKARELFAQAGWKLSADGKLRNAEGEAFEFEYLTAEAPSSREIEWAATLKKLGVTFTVRRVDYSLFGRRLEEYDFDTTTIVEPSGALPQVQDLFRVYHSKSALDKGNDNYRGVSHPAVDAVLKAMAEARSMAELTTASRALDRIVMWHFWQVPQLYSNSMNVSYWNKFGIPAKEPKYFQIQVAPDLDAQIPWPLITWWIK